MLAAAPGAAAVGRGPVTDESFTSHEYDHPAAGWGAARSVAKVLARAGNRWRGCGRC
jgi:hypothetical protein